MRDARFFMIIRESAVLARCRRSRRTGERAGAGFAPRVQDTVRIVLMVACAEAPTQLSAVITPQSRARLGCSRTSIMPLTLPVPPASEFRELVRRAFDREVGADAQRIRAAADDRARFDAASRLSDRVLVGLTGWFGTAGTRALASRALSRVQQEHELLRAVRLSNDRAGLQGLYEAAVTDGAMATVEGVLQFLEAFAAAMGRLLNSDLTTQIFDQCAQPDFPSANAQTAPMAPTRQATDD